MIETAFPLFSQLLCNRRSCRDFLPDAVPEAHLRSLLEAARSAPSSANLQPGKLHVLTGTPLAELTATLSLRAEYNDPEPSAYRYFPSVLPPELQRRQQEAGYALYRALNIQRRDIAARRQQFAANYRFFDAPVGIIVTMHKALGAGCYMDLGMLLMTLFLTANNMHYGCCIIGAMAHYGETIHQQLNLPDDEIVVCGVALGFANPEACVNQFRTSRISLDEFTTFRGFTASKETQ